jgi:NADPH:quinone reductase-like Zn-dependent oxidoreductase
LIHAIGSGVGTAAAQLGRMMGLTVIGTSRTPDKLERCRALGMTHGVLTTNTDWPAQVGEPVDVILDLLGAGMFEQNLSLLGTRGRLVVVGTITGSKVSGLDLGLILRRRLEIIGTAMRSRSLEEKAQLVARFEKEVVPRFEDGTLQPIVEKVFAMDEAERAYELLASNRTFGKIVLKTR